MENAVSNSYNIWAGLPVVASALPANKEIVQDGSNGYIVTNETEWYDSLEN
jgi:glycosyltransferase involved in cell wall biosynthesis